PDNQHVAYIAQSGAKWHVVVDRKAGRHYDGVRNGSLIFSSDGKRISYVARSRKLFREKRFVVVDGKEEKQYDDVGEHLVFSPNGQRMAYSARLGKNTFVV